METLQIIGLVILGIILLVGIVRVILAPWNGFINFLLELMLLDWLGDAFSWVWSGIVDGWED